jgi:hypothetical protein
LSTKEKPCVTTSGFWTPKKEGSTTTNREQAENEDFSLKQKSRILQQKNYQKNVRPKNIA